MAKLQKKQEIWTRLDNFLSLNWIKLDFLVMIGGSNLAK